LILKRFIIALLGAFAKLRKATISFVMTGCLPVRLSAWNNSAPTGRIFKKFGSGVMFRKTFEKMPVSLKMEKNNGYFT